MDTKNKVTSESTPEKSQREVTTRVTRGTKYREQENTENQVAVTPGKRSPRVRGQGPVTPVTVSSPKGKGQGSGTAVAGSSKGKSQGPETAAAGSSKGKEQDEKTAVIPEFPSAPVLRTEKEKAAWEKYKDQFETLCAALKNEGVEVMLVSSPAGKDTKAKKGTKGGKKQTTDKDESDGKEDNTEDDNDEEAVPAERKSSRLKKIQDQMSKEMSDDGDDDSSESNTQEKKKRGRGVKTPGKSENEEESEIASKKRGIPVKSDVSEDEKEDDKGDEDGAQEEKKKGRTRKNSGLPTTDNSKINNANEDNNELEEDSTDETKKDEVTESSNKDSEAGTPGTSVKRGRGRPPKTPKDSSEVSKEKIVKPVIAPDSEKKGKRGRPKKDEREDGDKGRGKKLTNTPVSTPVILARSGRIRKTPARYLDSAPIEISDAEDNEEEDNDDKEPGEITPKGKQGRPRKIFIKTEPIDKKETGQEESKEESEKNETETPQTKKRGHPLSSSTTADDTEEGVPKKRGRPPKSGTKGGVEETEDKDDESAVENKKTEGKPKKKVTSTTGNVSVKQEPKDNSYPHSSSERQTKRTMRKRDNYSCENCDKEFVLECLLERHARSCVKKAPKVINLDSPVKENKTEDVTEKESPDKGIKVLYTYEETVGGDAAEEDKDGEEEVKDGNKRKRESESERKRESEGDNDGVSDNENAEAKKSKITSDEVEEENKADSSEASAKIANDASAEASDNDKVDDEKDEDFLPNYFKYSKKVRKGRKGRAELSKSDLLFMQMSITDGQVECSLCDRTFKDAKYLRRHMAIHTGIRDFTCKICKKSFMRKYDLHIHMIRVHSWVKTGRGKVKTEDELEEGEVTLDTPKTKKVENVEKEKDDIDPNEERPFVCPTCDKSFRHETALKIHQQTHTNSKSFLCDLCGKGFSLDKYLAKHRLRHEKEGILCLDGANKLYKCPICQETFEVLASYQTHMKTHKDGNMRVFHCDQCPKGFFKLAHLKRHLLTHTTERAYSCALCDKAYKDPDTLRKHQKFVHSVKDETTGEIIDRKTWPCDECGKVFYNSGHLKRHKFRHTGERPFPCDTCGKAFAEKKSLENHVRIHTGDRPYACEECGRRFIQVSHLRRHRYLHSQVRNYECPQCKKRFFEKTDLAKHVRTHSNIRPFKCDICPMSFSQKNILVCHRRRHTGEKPFICDICCRAFTQLGSLQTHRRLHTGERPYKCHYCNQGFVSKERMKFHTFIHTGITPHICHICGKGFRLKFKLQAHIDSHEGIFRHKCQFCAKGFLERAKLNRHMKQVHNEDRPKNMPTYAYRDIVKEERETPERDGTQEIIIRNLGHFDVKEGETEEVIETTYVTIPSELAEGGQDPETNNAISHITLDASEVSAATAANIGALFDGATNSITIPQDSIIYEGGDNSGEEVVYVVIPEENQTVILS